MDTAALMSESPSGGNHGRKAVPVDDSQVRAKSLSPEYHEAAQGLGLRDSEQAGFYVQPGEECYHGMVAHRGVLTEEETEWLDWDLLEKMVEQYLGFDVDIVDRVYGPGGLKPDLLAIRNSIDSRLLEVQEAGGNMLQLATALGWSVRRTPTGVECRRMTKALARARAAREESREDSR